MKLKPSPLLFQLTILTCFSFQAQAQFNRYKTKTKFNNKNKEYTEQKSAADLIPKNKKRAGKDYAVDNSGGSDIFGRGTGVNSVKRVKKPKHFVNLNFETAFGPEVVTSFNFPDTSLTDLTKQMQKLTGMNLIMDKELKGKVTIVAPTAITMGDAWRAYLTALEINGYTLVKSGAFYKIVSTRDIRYTPTKIYTGNFTPNTDNYVMKIIPLKNINSTEVTRSFRPFMSRYGRLIEIKQTNTIIVQDTGSNINRLTRLIKFIDVPGHEETLQIIPVKHSSAQEIAKLLDQILKGGKSSGGKFRSSKSSSQSKDISKIIAEPRTNTIIAMANASGGKRLRSLIKRLDVKDAVNNGGRIHVYYLNYGDAETLAKTLSSLVSGNSSSRRSSRSRLSRRSSAQSSSASGLFSNDVKITSDKENNAIVVTASPTDYLTLKNVIKKLDIPKDQVYVEGLMMETDVTRNKNFGVSLLGAYGSGAAQRIGTNVADSGLSNLLAGQVGNLGGLFSGLGIGRTLDIPDGNGGTISVNSVNGLISAVASNSSTNVLATPQILALDNVEATFEVGESVPIPETQTAPSGITTTSTRQQNVGLTLKITPQINKVTRFVKLKIDQKIQDFSERPLNGTLASQGVGTIERSTITTVVVRDKDTVAMGGLMRDRETHSISKVPLLGDIPVLGWLFKTKRKTVQKLNLLFFMTPRILTSYQKDSSGQLKDVLNRRGGHLKKEFTDDDPFGSTAKGLYDKAKKQSEGPLYDTESIQHFQDNNEDTDGIGGELDEESPELAREEITPPNYQQIVQEISRKKAAIKRKK